MAAHPVPRLLALALSAALVLGWLTACGGGSGGGGSAAVPPPPTAKAWGVAALIETDNAGPAYLPQVAMDGNGNALAVWQQHDGMRFNLWSNRYTVGAGWGVATLIETDNISDASDPQIAVNASGNGLAVWAQHDGAHRNIVANRYTVGTGWGTAVLIETDNAGNANQPQVVMDANGNGLAVWTQDDGTYQTVMANRYTAGSGWGTAATIETGIVGDAFEPRIAIGANGNALAVWVQSDGTRLNVWANRYTVGSGWGTAGLIETDNAGDAYSPRIALDANGNGEVVWSQFDGTRNNIVANRYAAGSGWGTATILAGASNVGTPQIAFDPSGNALAVWVQSDGARYSIWSSRYIAGTGWGTAALIETDNAGDAGSPQIACDASGNALAVWGQSDGTRINIWTNRYTAGSGWGTAALLETDNAGDANEPQIAIGGNGQALAVWYQSDGTRSNIWSNRFQ
ncbi:hypothetical protein [Geothrix edaphica]|uniref:Uncharacterized protein n=1 Tax=Geothrix edaphica TaxID=2927976 RepID=A0ABQ5Q0X0_9BACT|nr:hypothetical protein [Geothrix edaphica]GLH68089.1 hypothetical protein GETHED_24530 [Geothrix edaphica]